jgi:diguanylate cyclase (GGDEF)-like protein
MSKTKYIAEHKNTKGGAQKRVRELAVLNKIGRKIASTKKLDELWELIYKQICELLNISDCYISLYDKDREELYNVIDLVHGKTRPNGKKPRKFCNGRTEYIIRTNKPLLISGDIKAIYEKLSIVSTDKKAKSYAGAPITINSKVFGVLAVQSYERDDAYNLHTIEILSTIVNYTAIAIENARLYEETQRRLKEMTTLQKVGMEFISSLDISKVLQCIVESTLELTNGDFVHIFSLNQETNQFTQRAAAWSPQVKDHTISWPRKKGLTATVIEKQKPLIIEDAIDHPLYSKPEYRKLGICSVASFPLKGKWGVAGTLNMFFLRPHSFSKEECNLLTLLANQAAIAIENSRLYEEIKQLATTDHLTGIRNRRYIDEYFHSELDRAHRFNRRVSVLMIDIDKFKSFNDIYGHSSGDIVIKNVAQAILKSCRKIDVIGRYGGDEFAVILLEADTSEAVSVAERILSILNKSPFITSDGTQLPITVSIGIAFYPSDGKKAKQVFSAADAAMYRAKLSGGGQFTVFRTDNKN